MLQSTIETSKSIERVKKGEKGLNPKDLEVNMTDIFIIYWSMKKFLFKWKKEKRKKRFVYQEINNRQPRQERPPISTVKTVYHNAKKKKREQEYDWFTPETRNTSTRREGKGENTMVYLEKNIFYPIVDEIHKWKKKKGMLLPRLSSPSFAYI